jgi:hypothetical protein
MSQDEVSHSGRIYNSKKACDGKECYGSKRANSENVYYSNKQASSHNGTARDGKRVHDLINKRLQRVKTKIENRYVLHLSIQNFSFPSRDS